MVHTEKKRSGENSDCSSYSHREQVDKNYLVIFGEHA